MVARPHDIETHRALVVEDNGHIAYMLDFILRRVGFDVVLAGNGQEAQAAIEGIDPVDVIVLDLMLPYVSGFQLITEVRANPSWQHVPILVLSGKVLEQDIVKAFELGANDYVTKPFRPEELLARLRRLVSQQIHAVPV